MDAFYFDKFEVKSKLCWSAWGPKTDISIISNTANVYIENFKGNFNDNYEIIDPSDSKESPSAWSMITKPTDQQDLSIIQDSLIFDSSSLRFNSIVLLKDKYLKNGILRAEFIPSTDNGVISIIFKYLKLKTGLYNIESYYSFELINAGDLSNNQFVLRKFENGMGKELKSISNIKDIIGHPNRFNLGYKVGIPHLVQILVNHSTIKVSISVNSGPFITIMEAEDDGINLGQVGFGTFHAKVAVTMFEIKPPNFIFSSDKLEDFIKNGVDDLALNPYVNSSEEGQEGNEEEVENNNIESKITNTKFNNKNDPLWKTCVINNTTDKRHLYCNQRFSNEYKKKKCEVNFNFFTF